MPKRDVVVIGASAGGVEALSTLVSGLPVDFPAAVLVVLHVPPGSTSALPQILARTGPLPAKQAVSGDAIVPGRILVAAPDRHLIVYDGAVTLSLGPRENGHRPSIDVLFRSAAKVLGPRVVSVVLSGALDDGAAGVVAVSERGGVVVVQDPEEALHPSMPRAAMVAAPAEHVLSAAKIPALLSRLVEEPVDAPAEPPSELMDMETAMADLEIDSLNDPDRPGEPSGFSCPDCSGTLYTITEGQMTRFRCRVGHAWSSESLVAQQSSALEGALWMALRSLEEKAALTRELGDRAIERGHSLTGESFSRRSEEALQAAELVRDLIARITGGEPLELDGHT